MGGILDGKDIKIIRYRNRNDETIQDRKAGSYQRYMYK
jgi:hypothetical protein